MNQQKKQEFVNVVKITANKTKHIAVMMVVKQSASSLLYFEMENVLTGEIVLLSAHACNIKASFAMLFPVKENNSNENVKAAQKHSPVD